MNESPNGILGIINPKDSDVTEQNSREKKNCDRKPSTAQFHETLRRTWFFELIKIKLGT